MSNKRQERIAEAYQKEITQIIRYLVRDPRLDDVTITQVKITPDLRLAKVYYNTPEGNIRAQEIEKGLKNSKGYIKRELSQRVNIKYTPDLKFYYDDSSEVRSNIDKLFAQIENEKNAKNQENQS